MKEELQKRLEYTMKTLNMTKEEVLEMWEQDKEIDRGAKLFELDPELQAGAKKARQAERKKRTEPAKREPKQDADKAELMELLKVSLETKCDSVEQTKNGEIEMVFHDRKFKIVLSAPRK